MIQDLKSQSGNMEMELLSQIMLLKMLLSPLRQFDQSLKPLQTTNQIPSVDVASLLKIQLSLSDEVQRPQDEIAAPLLSLCNLNLHLLIQVPLLKNRSVRTQNLITNFGIWTKASDQMFSSTSQYYYVCTHSIRWFNKAITKQ